MALYITVAKTYRNTTWCRNILQGISYETLKKRISPIFVEAEEIENIQLYEEENHIILVGSSLLWTSQTLNASQKMKISPILITGQPFSTVFDISCCLPDYADATSALISYMTENGHDNIALFGINSDATSDVQKAASFLEVRKGKDGSNPQDDLYYNLGSMSDCFSDFFKRVKKYNAAICTNDFAAITMIQSLRKAGYRVPEDFFIASFTDSIIGRLFSPSITSVSLNFYELGKQAVVNYSLLCKYRDISAIKILAKYMLNVRESTMNVPSKGLMEHHFFSQDYRIKFYDDDSISNIIKIENLLGSCDEIDRNILYGLMIGEVYRKIALQCFISEETVKYRVRRFLKICGFSSKKQLDELLSQFISSDSLLNG